MITDLLYLRDAYLTEFDATVVDVRERDTQKRDTQKRDTQKRDTQERDAQESDARQGEIALDRTAFYPTGGGQPHDTGSLGGAHVVRVFKEGDLVWHAVDGDGPLPAPGDVVHGVIDWERRHQLMRTHTALHVLCGVIWKEWRVPVTGGNMEPLSARMDFEFDPLPDGFGPLVEQLVNNELIADHPIEVSFLPRSTAVHDEDLIRTKVSMIPESVSEIRVVDIVGLDKQADGGTHVRSTSEVGRIRVVKLENKGKGNKRVRVEIFEA